MHALRARLGARRLLALLSVAFVVLAAPGFALVAIALSSGAALAADGQTIGVPIGDWIAGIAATIGLVLVTVLTRALAFAPSIVKTLLTEQLLKRAIDYALAAVAGAAKGKVLEVRVANDVIRTAAQYAVDNGAPWLLKWIGDLGPKLAARLSAEGALPADASAANLALSPTPVPAR